MKKAILIALTLLAAGPATGARAEGEGAPVTLVLAGGGEANYIRISLSGDGRSYEIESRDPLEAGGEICVHPEGRSDDLLCDAPAIAGFEVNADGGDDTVVLAPDVPVPATLRGGPGADRLTSGAAADKVIGGPGPDLLVGRRGDDWIFGGAGRDRLLGGAGNDQLRGGPGVDVLIGGPGDDLQRQ